MVWVAVECLFAMPASEADLPRRGFEFWLLLWGCVSVVVVVAVVAVGVGVGGGVGVVGEGGGGGGGSGEGGGAGVEADAVEKEAVSVETVAVFRAPGVHERAREVAGGSMREGEDGGLEVVVFEDVSLE